MSFTCWLLCSRMVKQVELDVPFGCFTRISCQTISLLLLVNLLWMVGGGSFFYVDLFGLLLHLGGALWHAGTRLVKLAALSSKSNCNIFGSCIPVFSLQCQLIEKFLGSGTTLQVN